MSSYDVTLAPASAWRHYVAIARPDHWIKHVFILPGLVAGLLLAPLLPQSEILRNCLIGFLSACLAASANYVINEWLDAECDRNHPEKMTRPAAGGLLRPELVYLEYAALAALGVALASTINLLFLLTTLALLASGFLYNVKPFRTKDKVYLDVLSEAFNNPIRLTLGWAMVSDHTIPPLSLVIAYWAGGAFLMAAKRLSEYQLIVRRNGREGLGLYRRSFSLYSMESLIVSCFVYTLTFAFTTAVFLIKYRAEYLFTFPLIIVLFSYYLHLGLQPESVAQKPEKLHRDWRLMALVGMLLASAALLTVIDLPPVERLIHSRFVEIRFD